jgi:glycosyltransferase involved in cell wall biosynthesis
MPSLTCSIGIMAYNEAANIAEALESILEKPPASATIREVIVVASGCTDNTVGIVSELAAHDGRIQLIVQERREGKAAAINLFLATAQAEILVMVGADVIVKEGSLDALLRPLEDPTVGMVGAHPIPVNDQSTFLGYAVHLLWRLHDRIARRSPKLGEMVAFRNVVPSIPRDTAVDEISIQALIKQLNYRLVYEPRAVVYNRGPATAHDFLRQRRRIYSGHLTIRRQQRYEAATMSPSRIGRALLAEHPFTTPQMVWWTLGTIGLEALARLLGTYDYLRRRPYHLWQMALTTKAQIAVVASGQSHLSVLVFHIVGYDQCALELGMRGTQVLMQRLTQQTRGVLGSTATVNPERNGTIIALLPVGRDEAERRACELIETIGASPVSIIGQQDEVTARLTCGIISFMQTGSASATSVPAISSREPSATAG